MTVRAEESRVWYLLEPTAVAAALAVDPRIGLDATEAATRLERAGPNQLEAEAKEPLWRAILRQYQAFMQLLLVGAAVFSFVISEPSTGVLLLALTVLNAWLGYRQEAKAQAAVAALAEMMEVTARVRRSGEVTEVDARQLVPGDVVEIEAGDLVPADGRLVQSATLEVEESALTGESQPSAKDPAVVEGADVALGDRHCMVFMNTQVTRGTGTFMVTSIGMATEMGRIAGMLREVKVSASPLQRQMNQLAKVFAYLAGATIALMVIAGSARGLDRNQIFLLAITVAIGAIPTGMPTVVTTLLSIGTRQLAAQHAVVKDLTSVETLGSTSAICSDKTGTLTLNQMTVRQISAAGAMYSVDGEGYEFSGAIRAPAGAAVGDLSSPLTAMALCSDATVRDGALIGDPTEGAVVTVAAKGGLDVEATRQAHPRRGEVPFDAAYKLMATFHDWVDDDGKPVVRCFVKGAPDVLLGRSTRVVTEAGPRPSATERSAVEATNRRFAEQGLRVLAVAYRDVDPEHFDGRGDLLVEVEGLTLLALFGIVDPPRPEARLAIATAKEAGVRVRMITGDHAVTAATIAAELGIEGQAVSGADLDHLDDAAFLAQVDQIGVFGRVAPEHKVRLVKTLQARGEIVAMTGDGVNDAPALKTADIGVAMGITGTEVSKQAARMVLTDDNFATIVEAVRLGRGIYENLMKYVRFQTSTLLAFVTTFVGATIFDIADGAPLEPLQILWVTFAITTVMAVALGFDTPSDTLMDHPPRDPAAPVLDRARAVRVGILGLTMGVVTLSACELAPDEAVLGKPSIAGTMAMVTLSLAILAAAVASRDEFGSLFGSDPLANPRLVRGLLITGGLTVLATELGFLQSWLSTTALDARQWGICLLGAVVVIGVDELRKLVERHRPGPAGRATLSAPQPALPPGS